MRYHLLSSVSMDTVQYQEGEASAFFLFVFVFVFIVIVTYQNILYF